MGQRLEQSNSSKRSIKFREGSGRMVPGSEKLTITLRSIDSPNNTIKVVRSHSNLPMHVNSENTEYHISMNPPIITK
jgi:hypothetical protein